jgi:hypothetical protein
VSRDEQAHAGDGRDDAGPVTPTELLRQALVDDEDPRFPRWLPLPGIALALAWAGYQAVAGDAGLLPTLGMSFAIFVGTTVAAWFGWQLEID